MKIELKKASSLRGEITPPPDKSISHRAIILSSLAQGKSSVRNFLIAADTRSTINVFCALGINIDEKDGLITVHGRGLRGLSEAAGEIDCGNSGTTIRLLSGVLAGNEFLSVLTGDDSLRKRPMGRIIRPLSHMGARITASDGDNYPPITIRGGGLKAISYEMPIASAQVKSAILLAGLYAEGSTWVIEPRPSRDHTERMLRLFGVDVKAEGRRIRVGGGSVLKAADVDVPGDFSSAAFFIGAALIVEGSELTIRSVGLNPLRTGLLKVLGRMGADVRLDNIREVSGEPVGDLHCRASSLKGVEIAEDEVPSMIDEFPVLCVVAARAEGRTTIRGASELRVKESDRISAMSDGLGAMGVEVEEFEDGLSIRGTSALKGAVVDSRGDHRVAMAFSVASLTAEGATTVEGAEAVNISFPDFYGALARLSR